MTTESVLGLVVVVAARDGVADTVTALIQAGALVGVVTSDGPALRGLDQVATQAVLGFRADSTDASAWDRVAPQLEQRLGPIDVVVADAASIDAARAAFAADLQRRGRGDVIPLEQPDVLGAVIQAARRTR